MGKIESKLNLNKTPNLVDNNSLIFAKNIRLDVDGSIRRDYGVFPQSFIKNSGKNLPVLCDDILQRIHYDITKSITGFEENNTIDAFTLGYYNTVKTIIDILLGKENKDDVYTYSDKSWNIVGHIESNNSYYLFISASFLRIHNAIDLAPASVVTSSNYKFGNFNKPSGVGDFTSNQTEREKTIISSFIVKYDEATDLFTPCNCNWSYGGGDITGHVITNLYNDVILVIGEYNTSISVPLKCINLNKSSYTDDESVYTQTPNIPLTNINYRDKFNYSIPNGVYQFFVRYKTKTGFYTNWFVASKELFTGNSITESTSFGNVKYLNPHLDSDYSFVLDVEHLLDYTSIYDSFQIGFICSHDESIVGRAWKHFDFTDTIVNFDYNAKDAIEIEISDLLSVNFQLYNVGNVTSFKNKLYIGNYTETDFNVEEQELSNYINNIKISLSNKDIEKADGNEMLIISDEYNTQGQYSGVRVLDSDSNNKKDLTFVSIFGHLLNNYNISKGTKVAEKNDWGGKIEVEDNDYLGKTLIDFLRDIIRANIIGTKTIELVENLEYEKGKFERVRCSSSYISIDDVKNDVLDYLSKSYREYVNNSCVFNDDKVYIYVNGKHKTSVDASSDSDEDIKEELYSNVLADIYSQYGVYLTKDFNFINKYGSSIAQNTITLYRDYKYKYIYRGRGTTININDPNVTVVSNVGGELIAIIEEYGTYKQNIFISFDTTIKQNITSGDYTNYTTLIPYQSYKFYVHYIKQNGEITNGYSCGEELTVPYSDKANKIFYPIFDGIQIPEGYIGCFFSILHTKNKVSHLYDITKNIETSSLYYEFSDIDIGLGLSNTVRDITVKQTPYENENSVDNAVLTGCNYNYSSDPSNVRTFGSSGIITYRLSLSDGNVPAFKIINAEKAAYAIVDYEIHDSIDVELIKCTPYLTSKNMDASSNNSYSFNNYRNLNLLGYINTICPIIKEKTINYYSDGTDGYLKTEDDDGNLQLTPLSEYAGVDYSMSDTRPITDLKLDVSNKPINVYSNFNINFLTLTEDPIQKITTYYTGNEQNKAYTKKLVLKLFHSMNLSFLYTLPSMYKSYTRKTYSKYRDKNFTRFENTIRSSELVGDETNTILYKFKPNDYYNLPTNRGKLINLIAVGDAIICHMEDSMFRFSGSNNIQSTDGEILTTESEPFDTGVSEIFGSDFGFAGLKNKKHTIMTELGYVFYDKDSNIAYLYSGQNQITKLTDSIEKLLRHRSVEDIVFANDYYNNRFFLCIWFYDFIDGKKVYIPVNLSFSILDNVKSFISLHDFNFVEAFNTKTKCYFLNENNTNVYTIDKEYTASYTTLYHSYESESKYTDKIYPYIQLDTLENKHSIQCLKELPIFGYAPVYYNVNAYASIIDVIVNENYEIVKTLNSIDWISNIISSEFKDYKEDDLSTYKVSEDFNLINVKIDKNLTYDIEYPCDYLRIYTDTCMTPLNNFSKRSNDASLSSADSYKYPRYNKGVWSFNYFRNIEHSKNNISKFVSDENSLIQGKYFVIRFIFNRDFKLETLNLNYSAI